MKTFLLLSVLLSTSTYAIAVTGIHHFGGGAPIYANITLNKVSTNMQSVKPEFNESVVAGNVNFDENELTLTLFKVSKCPPNKLCVKMIEAPVSIKLDIVHVKHATQKDCSVIYTAATPENLISNLEESVQVTDNSMCEGKQKNTSKVIYTVTSTQTKITAKAKFKVPNGFTRAQN